MTTDSTELLQRHHRVMGLDAPLFYDEPVQLVRGEGVWLYDDAGRRYLDLYNNVPCVGHANPHVVDAMARQAAQLNVHSRYLHEGVVAYAERLTALHPDGLDSVVFACSGSEANEVAIMMVRAVTGQLGIICTDAAYHGNTALTSKLTMCPTDADRRGVKSIATPQRYRPLAVSLDDDELCDLHIAQLEQQIAAFNAEGVGFAGVLMCPVFANEGLPEAPGNFFARMVDVVHAAGGLVIADEVQAGFARSGDWWGYETAEFTPDVAVMGKPMGNGLPFSAVVASHEAVTNFRRRHQYFNTFAASPLQAAAGSAVIDEIETRGLVEQAGRVGAAMRADLVALSAGHPSMGDVRGCGLFVGVDWVRPGTTEPDVEGARQVVEAMKRRGMLMGTAGQHDNVLKIRPPLVFDAEHAALFHEAFSDAVADVGS